MQDTQEGLDTKPLDGVIFDRDGVLIVDTDYLISPGQIRWVPGALELIRLLNSHAVKVMVATNQSGVARGYFDETQVGRLHLAIQNILGSHGLWIDAFEYCPHHPTEGKGAYTSACYCRKPNPGMLLKLMKMFNLDPKKSLMIGDRETDVEAAANAGVEGLLFRGTNLLEEFIAAGYLNRIPATDKH
jgi:D-glycero-D-manno-heptose 1,7-bisphosphate phosphatase